jgi:Fe-S-cluster containining protein
MDEPFYSNGLRFSCQRCSGCCRHDPGFVNLSEEDLGRLIQWAKMGREEFISIYCRWADRGDGYEYLCLKEKKNYDCILWDGGCIAYEARPFQCSSYPFWPSLLRDEDWWDANARDCPGIGKGDLHRIGEIETALAKRKAEPYIRRLLPGQR